MNARAEDINLAEMSDEEINNLDPETLGPDTEENPPSADGQGEDQSATSSEAGDNATGETDGAESVGDSAAEETGGADTTSADQFAEADTETQITDEGEQASEENQTLDTGSAEDETTDESTGDLDYKAEYSKLLAPFKAAKREIKIDTPEDARRLMQMGVDYARKMEQMKPYRRVLKTLEKEGLVDVDKINFLIDLNKKDPAAIRKFLKDGEIDPIDLDLEDGEDYEPTDHIVGDREIALDDILDEIRGTPSFDKTIKLVTKEWDSASQTLLVDNPAVIRHLNGHMETGIYDQIANKVATERALGRLNGLSDLEAYKQVGDAMHDNGEFIDSPNSTATSPSGNTNQGGSHPNGSDPALKARKRAASPTKGSASTGKQAPDFSKMTDKQIEEFDVNSL